MQTIRLRVNDSVYKHLMWFLKKFSKDEVEIIEEEKAFVAAQKEVRADLEKLEKREATFVDIQQLDEALEIKIRKYEA
jgi:hypothetical protein